MHSIHNLFTILILIVQPCLAFVLDWRCRGKKTINQKKSNNLTTTHTNKQHNDATLFAMAHKMQHKKYRIGVYKMWYSIQRTIVSNFFFWSNSPSLSSPLFFPASGPLLPCWPDRGLYKYPAPILLFFLFFLLHSCIITQPPLFFQFSNVLSPCR